MKYDSTKENGYVTSWVSCVAEVHYEDGTIEKEVFVENNSPVVLDASDTKTLIFNKDKKIDYLEIKAYGHDGDWTKSEAYVTGICFS